MNKVLIAVAISLLAGFALGAYLIGATQPEPRAAESAAAGKYFDQSAATEDRIRALEAAVAEERNARQLLEEELLALYGEMERLSATPIEIAEEPAAVATRERQAMEERRRRMRMRNSPDGRLSALVDGGFAPDRAEWIVKRESELQMELMQAQYDARLGDVPMESLVARLGPEAALRAEIGDTEYEQYLQATGRPTSVEVGNVLESSPGQRAGLQAGDQIVGYGGERIFSYWELAERTARGEPGQTVVVDIVRDGVPMQVVLPRGPIGISNSRGGWGRR